MKRESPMMQRVRSSAGHQTGFHIPKRGRIRFLLSLIFVVLAFRFAVGLLQNDSITTAKKDSLRLPKGEPVLSEKPEPQKKKHSFWKWGEKREVLFTIDDVSALLKKFPPRLSFDRDTIMQDRDTLVVFFSIDTSLQKYLLKLIKQYHPKYGSVVLIDPENGRVLSLISYTNEGERDLGSNLYCRSIFPAASVYKTITAAAAIEKAALNSQSLLPHVGRNHTLYKFQLVKELRAGDLISFEEAYAQSVNPVFARIGMYLVGVSGLDEYSRRFGFNTIVPFELENEAGYVNAVDTECTVAELSSGFNQSTTISPLLGAMIAGAICDGGKEYAPTLVDSIRIFNRDTCIYRAAATIWRRPVKENTAGELRVMMQKVARSGTARKSFRYVRQTAAFNEMEYGGKTGSVDMDSIGRIDWFIGFARDLRNSRKRIAAGVVTAHGENWTVHSSFLAAEAFRMHIRKLNAEEKQLEILAKAGNGAPLSCRDVDNEKKTQVVAVQPETLPPPTTHPTIVQQPQPTLVDPEPRVEDSIETITGSPSTVIDSVNDWSP